uniref:Mitochondrial import inner membrane translocase subunit n=1 Tax=Stygiella incarcerata TaxID=1712417 RepID=A0A192ZIM6_9EUKA|nr:Tim10 [Stygiella incarcerata]
MNFLWRQGKQTEESSSLKEAGEEALLFADMFGRIVSSCYHKCIESATSGGKELSIAEGACVDRCVSKFLQAQQIIADVTKGVNIEPSSSSPQPSP